MKKKKVIYPEPPALWTPSEDGPLPKDIAWSEPFIITREMLFWPDKKLKQHFKRFIKEQRALKNFKKTVKSE